MSLRSAIAFCSLQRRGRWGLPMPGDGLQIASWGRRVRRRSAVRTRCGTSAKALLGWALHASPTSTKLPGTDVSPMRRPCSQRRGTTPAEGVSSSPSIASRPAHSAGPYGAEMHRPTTYPTRSGSRPLRACPTRTPAVRQRHPCQGPNRVQTPFVTAPQGVCSNKKPRLAALFGAIPPTGFEPVLPP
jgi:hypothetical protein